MSERPWYVPANRVHVGKVPAVPSCPDPEPCQLAEAADSQLPTAHKPMSAVGRSSRGTHNEEDYP